MRYGKRVLLCYSIPYHQEVVQWSSWAMASHLMQDVIGAVADAAAIDRAITGR